MTKYKVTTKPAIEPITTDEAKLNLRISDTAVEDELVSRLIQVAREWCEVYENRKYITQTITAKYDYFSGKMILPVGDVISVTSVKYLDDKEAWQTISNIQYVLDNYDNKPFVYIKSQYDWPTPISDMTNVVEIIYQAGYGSTAANVPARTRQAMMLLINHLYEHREQNTEMSLSVIPFGVKNLLTERTF